MDALGGLRPFLVNFQKTATRIGSFEVKHLVFGGYTTARALATVIGKYYIANASIIVEVDLAGCL